MFLSISENLLGSTSNVIFPLLSVINPSIGSAIAISSALTTSIAILVKNEYISKSKLWYTKLGESINLIILLYEKTLRQSMIDKKKLMIEGHRKQKRYKIIIPIKEY